MAALEIISGFVTAPSTTFTAWTLASGNSLTVRNAPLDSKIQLIGMFATNQSAGQLRLRSPRLHDNVAGITLNVVADDNKNLFPLGAQQPLISQDTLVAEQTGSATAGDIEQGNILIYYDNLPGINGNFISPEDVSKRTKNIMTATNTLNLGSSGGYSGEETIVAEQDNFKANTDYALIGYQVSAQCGCVRWRGSDTGNLGVGGPGDATHGDITRHWFELLSLKYSLPLIPVFNSANKFSILVDGTQDEDYANVTLNSIFAELAPTS